MIKLYIAKDLGEDDIVAIFQGKNKYMIIIVVCSILIIFTRIAIANFTSDNTTIEQLDSDESKSQEVIYVNNNDVLVNYKEALEILSEGTVAEIIDVETGIQYFIKRIGGVNHADVETLTAEDTQKLKDTYGGEFSWQRRAIIVKVGDRMMAGSMAGMPHAGREDAPFGAIVDNRSGGAGRGVNLNSIRDNNLNGVVDIYFYNSLIPGLNRIDERHQHMVRRAAEKFTEMDM